MLPYYQLVTDLQAARRADAAQRRLARQARTGRRTSRARGAP
jgi:hypothetical protein